MKSSRRFLLNLLCTVALIASMVPFLAPLSTAYAAGPTELFFSEYIEGSSNNKALEIYNGTGAAVDLSAGEYNIQQYSNGSASAGLTINLTGTVADGDVYVFAHSSAAAAILAQADQTSGAGLFNGNDALVLRKGTTILDVIGQVGFNPGTEWGTGVTSTADNTLRRKDTVCAGDTNGADVFDPAIEWVGFASNTFDGLGAHIVNCPLTDAAPAVTSTYPVNGATDFPIGADLTVTFSEPVDTATGWFQLSCSSSGTVAVTISGGPTDFALDPDANLVDGETCTLTLYATGITDQDTNDPPDNMAADVVVGFTALDVCALTYTPIYDIQGNGLDAAITGMVTTQGVVVGDYETPSGSGQIRGFFIQDLTGDGDDTTSDGIFVYNGSYNDVEPGDVVRVTGNAVDYQDQTQISLAVTGSALVKCDTGSVEPVDVNLPFATADFPERYEGMLVRLPQTLYVTENYQLGRFGEILLSSGDRLWQPTHLFAPGDPGVAAQLLANSLNQILLDDGDNLENKDPIVFGRGGLPLSASNTLRSGDTATGIVGVLTYTWGGNSTYSPNAYRVRPVNALGGYVNFAPTNERPAAAPDVGGTLRVAGMNLLNFFNTFGADDCTLGVGGEPTECRGAWDAGEFARQWPKTVAAIVGTQADIVGVIEVENDGYGPDSALQFLVDKLNEATAPGTYAFIDADAGTGQVNALGVDAIKVGLLYKPAMVTPVGQTAALNTVAFVNGGDLEPRNRPALAQAFEEIATGGRLVVSVNHLKSKGSACDDPDTGDGQGNCAIVRENAATELVAWLAGDPTGTGDPDALIIGDLNSYAREDPITVIRNAGYTNLLYEFGGDAAYSYVFDGMSGYLDHALSTASLTPQVTGVAEWHINTDEPSSLDYNEEYKSAGQLVSLYAPDQFRVSDHDPVIVGLDLVNDPHGYAFVTGGGWFESPPGTYPPNRRRSGKATFSFVCKYQPGEMVPEGNTEFHMQRADLRFSATSYDWLLVSGAMAQFKGLGTINRAGEYGFIVTLIDGQMDGSGIDKFRIKIWNTTNGTVIYDSQIGAPDYAAPTMVIKGGNIVIHK